MARQLTPTSWESQPVMDVTIDDLDKEEILRTLRDMRRKSPRDHDLLSDDITEALTRLKLIDAGKVTNAAVVLFAKDIPGSHIQCVAQIARFRGLDKLSPIQDNQRMHGNAFYLLGEIETGIQKNTLLSSEFIEGQMAREDVPEYPYEAVRESVINALCHRDYASPGGSITVTIYDDRLEIINTGLLPSGITLADLKKAHTSHPRNPRITDVFHRRGYIEKLGLGTQKIIQACQKAKMKPPEFFEQAGCFVTRLWSRHYEGISTKSTRIEHRRETILKLLADHPLSTSEILELMGQSMSIRTLRNDLNKLASEGLIKSVGTGKNLKWSQ